MTTIRASCPVCEDANLEMKHTDITVMVCADNQDGSYHFKCPKCQASISRPAISRVVDLLISSGCSLTIWQLPDTTNDPPLTIDDLAELHSQLETISAADLSALLGQP